jgi:hypothetical protein
MGEEWLDTVKRCNKSATLVERGKPERLSGWESNYLGKAYFITSCGWEEDDIMSWRKKLLLIIAVGN